MSGGGGGKSGKPGAEHGELDTDYGDDPTVMRQLLRQACRHSAVGGTWEGRSVSNLGGKADANDAYDEDEDEDEDEHEHGGKLRGRDRSEERSKSSAVGATTTVLAVPLTLIAPTNPLHLAKAPDEFVGSGVGSGVGTDGDTSVGGGVTEWRCLGTMVMSVKSPDPESSTDLSESQLMWAAGKSIVTVPGLVCAIPLAQPNAPHVHFVPSRHLSSRLVSPPPCISGAVASAAACRVRQIERIEALRTVG